MHHNIIKDKVVVEKPSFIEIIEKDGKVILHDYLYEQRIVLSSTAYDIFMKFDGNRNIGEVVTCISDEYDIPEDVIKRDVSDLVLMLKKMKIIIIKKSMMYIFLKLYYKLIFYKSE